MLDFYAVRNNEITIQELTGGLTINDLRQLTNEIIKLIFAMIIDCIDEDVIFVPFDLEAYDPMAADVEDQDLAWTLGHVIVHTTASSEESAALAAELARGVPFVDRRSRHEIPWQEVKTIAQCRQRLDESRRICLASLEMWPDEPCLDNTYSNKTDEKPRNAVVLFVGGLSHADSHLNQIANIIKQAHSARRDRY